MAILQPERYDKALGERGLTGMASLKPIALPFSAPRRLREGPNAMRAVPKQQLQSSIVPIHAPDPSANRLLALLSPADYALLQPHLEPVRLTYRRLLYQANKPIEFVYF